MACPDVFKALRVATESLGKEIYSRATVRGVFSNLIKRSEYPMGVGTVRSAFSLANSHPDYHDPAWPAITAAQLNTGSGTGLCSPTYTASAAGYREVTYVPEAFNLKGLELCRRNFPFQFNVDQFLMGFLHNITKSAKEVWEDQLQSVQRQLSYKYVITGTAADAYSVTTTASRPYDSNSGTAGNGLLTGVSYAAPTGVTSLGANSALNQDHLDNIAMQLTEMGANMPDDNGFIDLGEAGPLYSLWIHPLASKAICFNSTNATRTDLQYAGSSELLKRMGATRTLRNWRHVPNMFPARFGLGQVVGSATSNSTTTVTVGSAGFRTVSAGMPVTGSGIPANTTVAVKVSNTELTLSQAATTSVAGSLSLTFGTAGKLFRVETYSTSTTGGTLVGTDRPINTAWQTAPIEEAVILSPWVFEAEMVRPVSAVGSMNWKPTNYIGDWSFQTGGYKWNSSCADPDEDFGCHFATMIMAPRPIFPEYGGSIYYLRS